MTTTTQPLATYLGVDVFGNSWEGRRVTVVGLGKSGVAAAELLCRIGCRVQVTESSQIEEMQAARTSLGALGAERVELGGHTREVIEGSELVVVSPGVPESAPPLQWAIEQQVPIISEIELAFHFCPSPIVAVTGTNGKSTAVTLIAELLKAGGRPAVACGNLGIPFSSVVEHLTPQMTAVVEVSSFQLLRCERFRPTIAVLLNIGTNHLDRHQDKAAYLAAKARLFQCQHPEDWAVLNGHDPHIAAIGERLTVRRVWFGDNRSNSAGFRLDPETLRSLTESAQAVLQVGRILGIPDPLTSQVIRHFRGLPYRLEFVASIRGVRFINDSKSTTPESLLFALERTPGALVLILGGRDKGLDFRPLIAPLRNERITSIVLIGESRAKLRRLFDHDAFTHQDGLRTDAGELRTDPSSTGYHNGRTTAGTPLSPLDPGQQAWGQGLRPDSAARSGASSKTLNQGAASDAAATRSLDQRTAIAAVPLIPAGQTNGKTVNGKRVSNVEGLHSKFHEAATLEEAIRVAARLAGPGATVLFSPACASFDMFRNFEKRGLAFRKLVEQLMIESVEEVAVGSECGAG